MNQPGMEPMQTRDPAVPQPTVSPETVTEMPEAEQLEVEPPEAEQPEAEPPEAEPHAASVDAEPSEADPPEAEPSEAELPEAESSEAEPPVPGSSEAEPSEAELPDAESAMPSAQEDTDEFIVSGPVTVAAQAAGRRVSGLARGAVALIGRHKLETIAVLLLGVGGAVYPPVWILGVLAALPSKTWDLRDKWTGLVAPVLLVIVSTVLIVVVGGKHPTYASYALEAWLGAGRVTRVATALGAVYLLWRLRRGRREPKQPPWEVPHRLG